MSLDDLQTEQLGSVMSILRQHDFEMTRFFNNIFDLLKIDKSQILQGPRINLRTLFFFSFTTRQGVSVDNSIMALQDFNEKENELIFKLASQLSAKEKFLAAKIVYTIPGIGQKVGSLFLELLILYAGCCKELLPCIYVPIDKNLYRVLIRLGISQDFIPNLSRPYQMDIDSRKFLNFQEKLRGIAEDKNSNGIYFDYLWYVGHEFCREYETNCKDCWITLICKKNMDGYQH